jgi:hypothetical protein
VEEDTKIDEELAADEWSSPLIPLHMVTRYLTKKFRAS